MKIVAKPIEMIAHFEKDGTLRPLKFRFNETKDESVVIKVDRVISAELEKFSGNHMIVYRCQSLINEVERIFELKYEISMHKWILFKI